MSDGIHYRNHRRIWDFAKMYSQWRSVWSQERYPGRKVLRGAKFQKKNKVAIINI